MNISKFIELSKWFHRKSQHYIMGNWYEYEKFQNNDRVNDFRKGYIKAYLKFMWLSREDWI